MFYRFNANWEVKNFCRTLIVNAGIVLPAPSEGRSKVSGFMGSRGEYTVGDYRIDTYGHYADSKDDSHYSLKFYKGEDTYWHLVRDDEGNVWYSKQGTFNLDGNDFTAEQLPDLEKTEMRIE